MLKQQAMEKEIAAADLAQQQQHGHLGEEGREAQRRGPGPSEQQAVLAFVFRLSMTTGSVCFLLHPVRRSTYIRSADEL